MDALYFSVHDRMKQTCPVNGINTQKSDISMQTRIQHASIVRLK